MPTLLQNGIEITGVSNDAALINYDNSNSGLEADNINEAIDEVNEKIDSASESVEDISKIVGDVSNLPGFEGADICKWSGSYTQNLDGTANVARNQQGSVEYILGDKIHFTFNEADMSIRDGVVTISIYEDSSKSQILIDDLSINSFFAGYTRNGDFSYSGTLSTALATTPSQYIGKYARVSFCSWNELTNITILDRGTTLIKPDNTVDAIAGLNDVIKDFGDILGSLVLDKLYPIGSIYLETTNTNPSSKLGGTWEAYGASDTYLRLGGNGSGGSNSTQYTPSGTNSGGSVGGHTLTQNEIPSHRHYVNAFNTVDGAGNHRHNGYGESYAGADWTLASGSSRAFNIYNGISESGAHNHTIPAHYTDYTGGGGSHGHGFTNPTFTGKEASIAVTPKYVQVYAWKRTA